LQHNDRSTNELCKDVSAFANSAGGVIIYGIKEDSINDHLPVEIEPIDRRVISKEWVEQIIQSQIQPRLDNVVITPIEVDGEINKVVFVIEVPQSTTAHQANDKKYYKRFNFNNVPMHDYEIRDILNRSKTPSVTLEFEIKIVLHDSRHYHYRKPLLETMAKY
jgi:predicted HTH transcriptional regulator